MLGLTSVKFATELHLCLNILEVIAKSHLSELNAESKLAALFNFVLILNIRVHIAKEQLFVR